MGPLDLRPADGGLLLPVKARAGASRNAVTGVRAGELLVSVTQAPERGKANAAIAKLIARALGVRASQVRLASGGTSPRKRFLVQGLDAGALRQKVAALMPGDAES